MPLDEALSIVRGAEDFLDAGDALDYPPIAASTSPLEPARALADSAGPEDNGPRVDAGGEMISKTRGQRKSGLQALTPRESEILMHLMTGESNKGIARHLGTTEATVKVHLKSVLRKIPATNRTQAAIWAMDNGFGQPSLGT